MILEQVKEGDKYYADFYDDDGDFIVRWELDKPFTREQAEYILNEIIKECAKAIERAILH